MKSVLEILIEVCRQTSLIGNASRFRVKSNPFLHLTRQRILSVYYLWLLNWSFLAKRMIIIISDYSSINSPCHVCETTSIWWLLDDFGLHKVCTNLISYRSCIQPFYFQLPACELCIKIKILLILLKFPLLGDSVRNLTFKFELWNLQFVGD